MGEPNSTSDLCDRYADLYPGAIADVLDDRGIEDQILDPKIGPLEEEMEFAGVAYPVIGRPNRSVDEDQNLRNFLTMLGEVPKDGVVMYQTNSHDSAQIGELSVECLIAQQCRAAVLDGGARDLSHIKQNDFPLFCKFRTPADAIPRWEIVDWDTRAFVGGVEVNPGDIIVGDIDGLVIVPEEIKREVLAEAEELAATENHVRDAVREGTHPLEAYEEYGVF